MCSLCFLLEEASESRMNYRYCDTVQQIQSPQPQAFAAAHRRRHATNSTLLLEARLAPLQRRFIAAEPPAQGSRAFRGFATT